MRVGFQGEAGAFSHEACLRFAPELAPVGFAAFEDVIAAVKSGAAERAMLPVENSLAGPVEAVLRLLPDAGLTEVARYTLPIRMMLIGAPGGAVATLRQVASHPVALKQCRGVIGELGLVAEEVFDTAGAVRLLAEEPDVSRAALASRAAAELHGLPILRADVQDAADNQTTFILVRA
jgi:prephenate dehydratase